MIGNLDYWSRPQKSCQRSNLGTWSCANMGVSESSVPLNPMVLLIIIPIKWLFHWEYTLFSDNMWNRSPKAEMGTVSRGQKTPSDRPRRVSPPDNTLMSIATFAILDAMGSSEIDRCLLFRPKSPIQWNQTKLWAGLHWVYSYKGQKLSVEQN